MNSPQLLTSSVPKGASSESSQNNAHPIHARAGGTKKIFSQRDFEIVVVIWFAFGFTSTLLQLWASARGKGIKFSAGSKEATKLVICAWLYTAQEIIVIVQTVFVGMSQKTTGKPIKFMICFLVWKLVLWPAILYWAWRYQWRYADQADGVYTPVYEQILMQKVRKRRAEARALKNSAVLSV